MALRERVGGDGPSALRTLDNVLNLALVPGVVAHELAHAIACLLVGVEIREVVLFDWSLTDIREDQPFTARVVHAPAASTWKAAVVGAAPLVVNGALGLLSFRAVRLLLDPSLPFADDPGLAAAAYRTALADAGPLEATAAAGCVWIGLAAAMTAVPSVNDALVTAGPGGDAAGEGDAAADGDGDEGGNGDDDEGGHTDAGAGDGRVARPLVAAGFLLENFQSELGVVLVTVLAAVGLVGPGLALAFRNAYLAVFAVGVAYLLYQRWRRDGRSLFELPAAESQRAELIRQRVEAGHRPGDGAVAALIGQLDHHRWLVRQATLRALLAAAEEHPETVATHSDALLARWDAEPVTDGKLLVLQTLAELVGALDDREPLVRVALAETLDDRSELDVAATKLLAWVAIEDATPIAAHVDRLVDGLPDLEPKAQLNLGVALDEVAAGDPAALAGRRDRIRELAASVDDEAAEYLASALDRVGAGASAGAGAEPRRS